MGKKKRDFVSKPPLCWKLWISPPSVSALDQGSRTLAFLTNLFLFAFAFLLLLLLLGPHPPSTFSHL